MKHHATITRKNYKEIVIDDLVSKENKKATVGRRTGRNLEHLANGNDFLLKEDNLNDERTTDFYHLYSSDSDNSSSGTEDLSESEAEESDRENLSKNSEEDSKVVEPKDSRRDASVLAEIKEMNKNNKEITERYNLLEGKLLKDSVPVFEENYSDIENKQKSESDDGEEDPSPYFQTAHKDKNKENKPNHDVKCFNNINAKNNFKSNKKHKNDSSQKNNLDLSFATDAKVYICLTLE
jgi:hypothetical protein